MSEILNFHFRTFWIFYFDCFYCADWLTIIFKFTSDTATPASGTNSKSASSFTQKFLKYYTTQIWKHLLSTWNFFRQPINCSSRCRLTWPEWRPQLLPPKTMALNQAARLISICQIQRCLITSPLPRWPLKICWEEAHFRSYRQKKIARKGTKL